MKVKIGTSGWTYPHWRGPFYPAGYSNRKWLEYYSGKFDTVELNATFYRTMPEKSFRAWYAKTPPGFVWSVKTNRFITHIRRLQNAGDAMKRFLDAIKPLQEKQGPVLIQLPPGLGFDEAVFEAFCRGLPDRFDYAVEARHTDWLADKALSALRRHRIAFCISDTAGRYPYKEAVTAHFIYIRLHGSRRLYASNYAEEELAAWAEKIRKWNRDAFVYFDNDAMAYAPFNALRLKEMLA